MIDPRDARIAELEEQLRWALARIAELEARVLELEAQLRQNSANSSRPPSSDPPWAPRSAKRPPSGRRRGGQPGHEPHRRTLLPPDRVSAVHELRPPACRGCGHQLEGSDQSPYRHQVIDVPLVIAKAVEYRLHALVCPACGISTRAQLPPGIPRGNFGPRLQAMVAVCTGAYHLSKRMVEGLLSDFFDADISLGTISNLEQQTSEALVSPVEEAKHYVRRQPVVGADETGWTEAKAKAWLWVAVAANAAVFLIRSSRGAEVAKKLLGGLFRGILNSDRWSAYRWMGPRRRQLCWAHLLRQFAAFEDRGPDAAYIGLELQKQCERMFALWHRVRDGTLSRSRFRTSMRPIERQITSLLLSGMYVASRKVARRCAEILRLEEALFTFVREEGVEPTNNAAERALRAAVLWRKGSFGTESPAGSRFVERILTAVTTLRLQKRNVLEWLTAACQARLDARPAPSLLPTTQHLQPAALAA